MANKQNSELQSRVAVLEAQIQAYQQQEKELMRGKADVARAIEIEQQKLEQASKAWQEEKSRLQHSMETDRHQFERQVDDLKNEVTRLEALLAKEKEEYDKVKRDLEGDAKKVQSTLHDMLADVEARREMTQRLLQAETERDAAKRTVDELEAKIRALEEGKLRAATDAEAAAVSANSELESLRTQRSSFEADVQRLTERIQTLEHDNEVLAASGKTASDVQVLEKQLLEQQEEVARLKQNVASLSEENDDLVRSEVNVRNRLGLSATDDIELLDVIDDLLERAERAVPAAAQSTKDVQTSNTLSGGTYRHSQESCEHVRHYKRRLGDAEMRTQRLEARLAERENKYYQLRSRLQAAKENKSELSRERHKLELVSLAVQLWKHRFEKASDRARGLQFLKAYYAMQIEAKESCNELYLDRLASLGVYPSPGAALPRRRAMDKFRAAVLAVRAAVRFRTAVDNKSQTQELKARIAKVRNAHKRNALY